MSLFDETQIRNTRTSSHIIHMVENQFDTKVKIVRSDNGPEFKLEHFYATKGIFHQSSHVNTPQQNGVV